jgi:hypothetical protein
VRFPLSHECFNDLISFLDILNRLTDREDKQQTVHIMRYIFPRQFGLHNVFTSKVDPRETAMPFKDYTLREKDIHISMCRELGQKVTDTQEIAKWKQRLPKRLRGDAVRLVERLRVRNQRCSYMEMLRHYCPVEVPLHLHIYPIGLLTRTGSTGVNEARLEKECTSTESRCTISHRARKP